MSDEYEAIAWKDPQTDVIYVRVRTFRINSNRRKIKRGVIIKLTEEQFEETAMGTEYRHYYPDEITTDDDSILPPSERLPIPSDYRWGDLDEEDDPPPF